MDDPFDEWESEFDPQVRDWAARENRNMNDAERHRGERSGNAADFTVIPTKRIRRRFRRDR